jgi:hypothetical protein
MDRNQRISKAAGHEAVPTRFEATTPRDHPAPLPGIEGWDNEGGHAQPAPRDADRRRRRKQTTTATAAAVAELKSAAHPNESDAAELRRLSQQLAAIGSRVGQLGHTSDTLVLIARTTVLIADSLSSLAERLKRLEQRSDAASVPA